MSTQQRAVNDFPKAHNFIQGGDRNNTSSLVEIMRARVISFPAGQQSFWDPNWEAAHLTLRGMLLELGLFFPFISTDILVFGSLFSRLGGITREH